MATELEPTLRIDGVETSVQRKGLAARVGWTAALLLGASLGLVVLAGLVQVPLRPALVTAALVAVCGATLLAFPALAIDSFHVRLPGSIVVTEEELVLERAGQERRFPMGELVDGRLNPRTRAVALRLRSGDVVHVHVATAEDAHRLLVATGLGASQHALRIRLGQRYLLDVGVVLFSPLVLTFLGRWPAWSSVLLALALTLGLLRVVRQLLGPAELIIGADGLIVRQSFAARFIPFGRIASVDPGSEGRSSWGAPVILHLTDGTALRARTVVFPRDQREEVGLRIEEARGAWAAGQAGTAAPPRLDRNGRSAAAWRAALRELLTAPDGYREQAVTRDALLMLLESPATSVEHRVAAALALEGADDPEGSSRIRVAAGACADPRLRIALERAADGVLDDEAIDQALEPPRRAALRP